jgi:putative heme-binding domain-containing protein
MRRAARGVLFCSIATLPLLIVLSLTAEAAPRAGCNILGDSQLQLQLRQVCSCKTTGLRTTRGLYRLSVESTRAAPVGLEQKRRLRGAPPKIRKWTLAGMTPLEKGDLDDRDFEKGRTLFSVAHCKDCHRLAAEGGAIGPDLTTVAERLSPLQALEAILEPNKTIVDRYAYFSIRTKDGRTIVGKVTQMDSNVVHLRTNDLNPVSVEIIDRRSILQMNKSVISMMPTGLLNNLSRDDILDLLAYILSGGAADHPPYVPVRTP